MTQSNYFSGRYVGCDVETGLGMPKWEPLFAAYDIPVMRIGPGFENDPEFLEGLQCTRAPSGFIVNIDPMQTYFPKISSRVTASGSMASNPVASNVSRARRGDGGEGISLPVIPGIATDE